MRGYYRLISSLGNTVYVGLGFTSQPVSQPYRWVKSGTSILSFMLGSFLFARLSRALGPLRRYTLFLTGLLRALLVLAPAALSAAAVVPANAGDLVPSNLIVLLPLSLLAMSAGGQCVLSRLLGYNEIPTVVLTSGYCDLAMDEKIFSGFSENSKRNRRIASVVLLVTGAALGGVLTKNEAGIERALWAVGAVKLAMACAWLFWRAEARIQLE